MKINAKLSPLVLATSLAVTGLAVPMASHAEMSASFAASSMYLWRGQNLSPDGGVISGSLDYSNGGFYAGMWTSSESEGHETDFYAGFGGDAGDISYDISYAMYLYPEEGTDENLGDTDAAEVILKLGYGGFGLGVFQQVDSDLDSDMYLTLSYGMDAFGITYGTWMLEDDDADDYSHITFDYTPVDSLTFSVSKATGDGAPEEDPLFAVTWSQGFDL